MSASTNVGAPVLLVRAAGGEDRDAEALEALGIPIVEDPYLVVAPCADPGAVARAEQVVRALRDDADVLLLTSRAAVRALEALVGRTALVEAVAVGAGRGLWGAAVGPATAVALRELGLTDVLEPELATSRGLLKALRARTVGDPVVRADGHPRRAVLPCGAQAMKGLAAGLSTDGWQVEEVVVYTTEEVAERPPTVDAVTGGRIAALVLRSPTAVRAVARYVPDPPPETILVCGGPTTAAAAEHVWGPRVVVSEGPTPEEVARTVARALTGRAGRDARGAGADEGGDR